MAYRRKRAPFRRKAAPRRRTASRRRSSAGVQTVRLVIEQRPAVSAADLPIGMRAAAGPKKARF